MRILIIGANGFIGSHLIETLLTETDCLIDALDLMQDKLEHVIHHPRLNFQIGDMTKQSDWIMTHMQKADVILPLAAVATPATYVQQPLRVFELDFEANLKIVRLCAQFKKHVIFPSTSEVYGMATDEQFDEETTLLVTGPIVMERWIYSSAKQLMDRVIYAMGKHEGLSYTLFRPFNWYGPRLDNILNNKPGGSRVLTQFIGNILRGEDIHLVDGGEQKRCFTYIKDGVSALLSIIKNKNQAAHNCIFNIGNPEENISIRKIAEITRDTIISSYPNYAEQAKKTKLLTTTGEAYFGSGYQDVTLRVPAIHRAKTLLNWSPKVSFEVGLKKTLDFYLNTQ